MAYQHTTYTITTPEGEAIPVKYLESIRATAYISEDGTNRTWARRSTIHKNRIRAHPQILSQLTAQTNYWLRAALMQELHHTWEELEKLRETQQQLENIIKELTTQKKPSK